MKVKRFLSLLLVISLLMLGACNSSSGGGKNAAALTGPKKPVDGFCRAMQDGDLEKMKEFAPSQADFLEGDDELGLDELPSDLMDYLKDNLKKMTYKIGEVEEDGDKATVTVSFKYKDSSELFLEMFKEVMQKAMELAFSGGFLDDDASEDEIEKEMMKLFEDSLNKHKKGFKAKDASLEADFTCEKIDGEWVITDIDEDIGDVFTSGFLKASEDMENIFDFGGDF